MGHLKQDMIAFLGELVGTTMFIFLGLGGISTAIYSETASQQQTANVISLSNQTVMFISLSMGFSLLVNAWVFYRITGGLFNPAVTFALWAIGGVTSFRAAILTVAQIAGGMLGAGLVALLIPYPINNTITTLATNVNKGQGLMLEAFLTAMLVFTVLMLAAEKHKATFIAPIGIGLVLFVCQLFGTEWTGCGMNPARAFGPSVIGASFPGYHWIYWAGPYIGSLIAVSFYTLLKLFDYGSVVLGQDADSEGAVAPVPIYKRALEKAHFSMAQREAMAASGMSKAKIAQVERQLAENQANDAPTAAPVARPAKASRKASANGTLSAPNGAVAAPFTPMTEAATASRPAIGSRVTSMRPGAGIGGVQGAHAQQTQVQYSNDVATGSLGQDAGGVSAPATHTGAGLSKLNGLLA